MYQYVHKTFCAYVLLQIPRPEFAFWIIIHPPNLLSGGMCGLRHGTFRWGYPGISALSEWAFSRLSQTCPSLGGFVSTLKGAWDDVQSFLMMLKRDIERKACWFSENHVRVRAMEHQRWLSNAANLLLERLGCFGISSWRCSLARGEKTELTDAFSFAIINQSNFCRNTLPETNIDPENGWMED